MRLIQAFATTSCYFADCFELFQFSVLRFQVSGFFHFVKRTPSRLGIVRTSSTLLSAWRRFRFQVSGFFHFVKRTPSRLGIVRTSSTLLSAWRRFRFQAFIAEGFYREAFIAEGFYPFLNFQLSTFN